jgi:hypothetical protein
MPPLIATGARVNVQEIQFSIRHYLEYVGVPTNKQAAGRWICLYYSTHPRVVPTRISANVGHKNRDAGAFKPKIFRKFRPNPRIVYIAIHPAQGLESLKTIHDLDRAKVAGMPQLVAFCEIMKIPLIEPTMCIGKNAYARHALSNLMRKIKQSGAFLPENLLVC